MAGNQNSGRRPQPTALKVLRGNPGKRKLNAGEPTPPAGAPGRPDSLSGHAKAVWAELAPLALAMGTLTLADAAAFATLCELESTRRLASAEKNREGFSIFLFSVVVDGAGNERPKVEEHPAIRLERTTAGALRPYYEKFGLEPIGRARIRVPTAEPPKSKWSGVLA